jgi:uncharacterized protein
MEDPDANSIQQLADRLLSWFDLSHSYAVAFSGGVDSAVVAVAAHYSGVETCLITARGPSLSQRDQDDAQRVVQAFGLRHQWLETSESLDPAYQRNDLRRCFYCKSHLYSAIRREFPNSLILSGTNRDDLQDYRPGLEAAQLAAVRAPLAELNLGKQQVRQLAHYWNIPVAAKPASPCLASRLAYGVSVTPERLEMIEGAERFLRELLEIDDCRVRLHPDGLGRIELGVDAIQRALTEPNRPKILNELQRLGFRYVTIDLASQRSGSLNPIQPQLVKISSASR